MIKLIFFAISLLTISACGSSNDDSPNNANDTSKGIVRVLSISGDDTTLLGEELRLTEVAYRENFGFTNKVIIATTDDLLDFTLLLAGEDNNASGKIPNSDPLIVFNLMPFGISMRIDKGSNSWSYTLACTNSKGTTVNCSEINIDTARRVATLKDVVLTPDLESAATASLTINGTITWVAGDEASQQKNNLNNSVKGPLTDITGTWKQDDAFYYVSNIGSADEAYDLYFTDGTMISYGYFASLDCYDYSSGNYIDLGNGNISIDGDPAYKFIISGDTQTVTNMGSSYTATKSSLKISDFTPICDA